MTQASRNQGSTTGRSFSAGYLFGVPVGDLGLFSTLLVSVAVGFVAFFASTFLAIFGVLFYNEALHHAVDFTVTYTWVGLPVGVLVLVAALTYMGTLWVRRQLRRA